MATPPSSSSSSSASSPSPVLEGSLKVELGLDDMAFEDHRTDPLEFLLQSLANDASDSTSSQDSHSTPEWSQMASWEASDAKFDLATDFDFSIPMELDFQSNMAVDPSALHFNTSMFSQPAGTVQPENLFLPPAATQFVAPPLFSYDVQAQNNTWSGTPTQRRLSITSSSSSSGASLSPIPERSTAISSSASDSGFSEGDSTTTGRPKTSHTTIERRYRTNLNARITGLKQAVPALRVLENKNINTFGDVVDQRGFVDGVKVARKMSKANVLGKATEYIKVLKKRESRLAREQDGLRSLISGLVGGPALLKEWDREWREKFGGPEKDELEDNIGSAAASDDEDGDGEDSDEDGDDRRAKKKAKVVKAPKKEKVAKATPTPAVPITPGVLPEKRKRGRPRKNPLPPAPLISPLVDPSSMVNPNTEPSGAGSQPEQPAQPAPQYLLAAFAFFSIFNSPLASSYTRQSAHPRVHHGMVLTDHPSTSVPHLSSTFLGLGYSTHDLIGAFHLLVSTLVLFYVVMPWFSGALKRNAVVSLLERLPSYLDLTPNKKSSAPTAEHIHMVSGTTDRNRSSLTDALMLSRRGASDEAAQLRKALGMSTGVIGLLQSVIKAARIDRGIELNQLEQRAWVRLGEIVALNATLPSTTRIQTYWCMSWHIPTFKACTTDLSTLALIIRPVSHAKASELWDEARQRDVLRMHERVVLSTMSVDEAADLLEKWRLWREGERKSRCAACEKRTPLGILAAIITRFKLRKHAAAMFVRTVVPHGQRDEDGEEVLYDAEKEQKDEEEMRDTIEAAKSIGGRTADLAVLLERNWDSGFCPQVDVLTSSHPEDGDHDDEHCEEEHDLADLDAQEIRSLISATLIYRHIFPSSFPSIGPAVSLILSPPPSPSRKNIALHTALRTALGSAAFDYVEGRLDDPTLGGALEDARDRVVDMLVELERAGKRNSRY
ncbi:hypothetical protein EUX98_g3636 [Antrodiella citrinella]|uniref:BHLH domain-containing protein n=1 Tax=Antrodiella citrinella TaxID=2447956 RepID=A0A4S4MYI2_9APHY|nr:hypothetical protein EUX98_g3636 [Antrodiella citrinella]